MVAGGVDAPIAPLILRGFMLMRIMTTRWNARAASAPRGPFRATATASCSLKARGSSCWRNWSARGRAARTSTARSPATDPPAKPTIACAWKSAAKSRRAPSAWLWKRPSVPPEAVQYINYHGTSTELNDRIETRAVKLAFNGHAYKLAGSSLKSLIGHPQGACGAAGVAATLLAMRDGVHPAHYQRRRARSRLRSGLHHHRRPRNMDIEYAVANCIAFGSKNSALILRRG